MNIALTLFCLTLIFIVNRGFAADDCRSLFIESSNRLIEQLTETETAMLENVLSKRIFDKADFYDIFKTKPALARQLITQWYGIAFLRDWGPKVQFSQLDATVLLLDPGIVDRVGEFVNFSKNYLKNHSNSTVIELREAFSRYLGTTTFYRVLSLTEKEFRNISEIGMLPAGRHSGLDSAKKWFQNSLDGPIKDIEDRLLKNDGVTGVTLSVSEFKEVALAGAFTQVNPNDATRSLFLFEITTPEINVVRENQRISTLPRFAKPREKNSAELVVLSPDYAGFTFGRHEGGIEVFLFNYIPVTEITSMQPYLDSRPWTVDPWSSTKGNEYLSPPTNDLKRKFQVDEDSTIPTYLRNQNRRNVPYRE